MKKNRMMRLASTLLVLTLLTTSAVSGTFAKYTSTQSGTDTARVAKWSFEVGGTNIAQTVETKFDFDLFKTVLDEDLTGLDDAEVANGASENIIAPGTAGSFAIILENTSEVDARYSIDFSVANTNNPTAIPLLYSLDTTNWYADINYIDVVASEGTQLNYAGGGTTSKVVNVYWMWPFADEAQTGKTDSSDTALGIYAATGNYASVVVTAKVTATQVD